MHSSENYASAAREGLLHSFPQSSGVSRVVTDEELRKLYSNQLSNRRAAAYKIYEKLISASPHGVCPLCGEQTARTLDHHLPKGRFAALSIVPYNLVPACRDCQSAKGEKFPGAAEEQTLHPYFDELETQRWLVATVVQGSPAAVVFDVVPPANWSAIKTGRYNRHLVVFELKTRFALFAARELVQIRSQLGRLHAAGGLSAVRQHLKETADSRHSAWKNSWQTAMYEGCAASDWFCDTGFALT